MPELEPGQQGTRSRFETLIALVAPALDLVLAIGDRASKLIEPNDYEYYPVRDEDPDEDRPPSR